jgi:hypothetical protein
VILAQHLDRPIGRRFSHAIEFGQTSFARCHSNYLREGRGTRGCVPPLEFALAGVLSAILTARMRFQCGIVLVWCAGSQQFDRRAVF